MNPHTRHPSWPDQLVLPGQAAAPEGPVDMQIMYLMHYAFRRDLEKFAGAAQRTPVEDRTTWRLLARRWAFFAEVLHRHHSAEDAGLWPSLLAHGRPEDLAILEAMEAEHAEIDPLLRSCAEGLERLAHDQAEAARDALTADLAATRDTLAHHLAHEETDAMAILQRVMTQEEWTAIDAEYFKKQSRPQFVVQIVPWAVQGVSREVLDRIFAEAGLGFKLVWLATRRRFAAREARTFRHLP